MAILVAVGSLVFTNALIRGYQYDMLEDAILNLSGHIKVLAPGYRSDPSAESNFSVPGQFHPDVGPESLHGWTSRVVVPAVIISERETRGIQLVGIDPADEQNMSFLAKATVKGTMLSSPEDKGVLVGEKLVEQLNTKLGRRIVLISQGADGLNREAGFRIVGTYDTTGTSAEKMFVFAGRETLQTLLGTSAVTELSVRLVSEKDEIEAKDALQAQFPNMEVLDWKELQPQAAAMFEFSDATILIWFVIMASALAFGLVNTLITGVMERVRELGMFRALGMRPNAVLLQVMIESILIVVVGLAGGLVLGYVLVNWMSDGIDLSEFSQGLEMVGIRSVVVPRLMFQDVIQVCALTTVLGFLASLYPAVKAVRILPLDALRK